MKQVFLSNKGMQQGDLCNVMGNVGSGADPAGVVFGVRIPLPFGGTPNFLKKGGGGGESCVCAPECTAF